MCRMFASVGAPPTIEELAAFRGLCLEGCGGPHGDGWGMVGFPGKGPPAWVAKSTAPAQRDPAFEAAARAAAQFPVVIAHLRKASSGTLSLDNTHPFAHGPWAFAHNGTIRGGYAEKHAGEPGKNDSRVFFARVRAHLQDEPVEALRAALREVRDGGFAYSSITTLMSDGATLWAMREARERPEEYDLKFLKRGGRMLVCQEPILPGAWQTVPNGHVAIVRPQSVELVRL
jgi:predicted glutamine amidotransferase